MDNEVKLGNILKQEKESEYFSNPENEIFITVSSKGKGVFRRIITEGKTPVPFNGYRAKTGQLIYSRIGASDGAFGYVTNELNRAAVSKDFPLFKVDEGLVNKDYLMLFLESEGFRKKISRLSFGATLKRLKEDAFLNLLIKLPDLKIQGEIVHHLNLTKLIIGQKEDELGILDNLIKARFVEMFGDDKENAKKLSEITDVITKGTTPTTAGFSFKDKGINFFKIESITDDHRINLQKVAYVSEECHAAFRRSQLREGDILFSIAGAIGKTAIIHSEDLPGNTNQALAIIRLKNNSSISKEYLMSALGSPETVNQYQKKKRGVAQMNLSLQDIGNVSILIPDLAKQKEFEVFTQQVDKSKFAIQKSLEKTQLLFDSLMQEYFG